jgi:type IV secretory pathway component VirB8
LTEIRNPPYKAAVTFQKLLYASGTRSERGHQTYVAQIDFVMRDHVPNEFVRVNPLGLQITYYRVDQAFEEPRK